MLGKITCFNTQILEAGRELFNIRDMKALHQFRCGGHAISNPLEMIADPFLFTYGNTLYLFYEQLHLRGKGAIAMVRTTDLENWSEPVVVLDEPFHISFPWVFKSGESIFMVPESGADKSVRLYKAENDRLDRFVFDKRILSKDDIVGGRDSFDFMFADTSIINHKGLWYLFSTFGENGTNVLRLFVSRTFDGHYKEHPQSPVCISNKVGRNAGSILEDNGELFRIAQDCECGYGNNVHVLKIDELSETSFKEHCIMENILPMENPFYKDGGHQFNMVVFNGRRIVSTDAKEYRRFILNRLLFKLHLIKN